MKWVVTFSAVACFVSFALSSCASHQAVVTFDNAARAPLMLNVSSAEVGLDKVLLNPDEGAELRFDEAFPKDFRVDRWGRVYHYQLTIDPQLLDESALIIDDDMTIYLVQDGQVRNP
ncbi:MAG: hypothetical protein ACQKBU_06470, partial [Verrucomicrobiales bacterium]